MSPGVLKRPLSLGPAYLGVTLEPENRQSPVIASVDADSPAARAGIIKGDRLSKLEGHDVTDGDSLRAVLQGEVAGRTLKAASARR